MLSILGLDIQPDAVRVVRLCQSRRALHLAFIQEILPTARHKIAIALPYKEVQMKTLSIDAALTPQEIEALTLDEFNPKDWLSDFKIATSTVSVVACPKSVAEPYLKFKPSIIDVDIFAVERIAFLIIKAFYRDKKTVGVFHANAQFCSLSVFENGLVILRRYTGTNDYSPLQEFIYFEHLILITPPQIAQEIIPQLTCSFSLHTPSHVISTASGTTLNSDWTVACGLAL